MYDILQLNDMLVPELRELAESLGVDGYKKLNKQELVYTILDHQALAVEKKKKTGNGTDTSGLPDEVPVSSDNMRVDKRQPGAVLKRGRKPAHLKTEAPEAEDNTVSITAPEETTEITSKAETTPGDRPQTHRRPEHRERTPHAPREPRQGLPPKENRAPGDFTQCSP